VVCLQGIAFLKYTYLGCGVILTVTTVWYFFYTTVFAKNTLNSVGWVVLVCSVIVGLGVGFIFVKAPKAGSFFLGAIGGFGLALLLFNCVFYLTDSYWTLYSMAIGLALINGLVTLYQSEPLLIHGASLMGSYFFITGIGMLAG
jgi:hypothetical protein